MCFQFVYAPRPVRVNFQELPLEIRLRAVKKFNDGSGSWHLAVRKESTNCRSLASLGMTNQ